MLKPLVRFAIRSSNTLQDFVSVLKGLFVEVAAEELLASEAKVSVRRVSFLTGMHRRDVTALLRAEGPQPRQSTNWILKIIGQWQLDSRFQTKSGEPKVLTRHGEQNEFDSLVQTVSKEIDSGTALLELIRIGAVKKTSSGIKLIREYRSVAGDAKKGYELLAKEIDTLLSATDENIDREAAPIHLHLRTEYDNVFQEDLPQIREWIDAEGRALHKRAREFLSNFDRDINAIPEKEAGARVVIAAFSFTSEKG